MNQVIPYTTLPDPAPAGFSDAVFANGGYISSAPDGWHVNDAAAVLALYRTYSGSAAELTFSRNAKLAQLAALYLSKFAGGFNYTGPDAVKRTFQIDPTSQFNIDVQANASLGSILNGEAWDTTSYFIAADNSHMALPTAQAMRAFSLATRAYVSATILNNRALKDAISGAANMAALAAIDISAGWPSNP